MIRGRCWLWMSSVQQDDGSRVEAELVARGTNSGIFRHIFLARQPAEPPSAECENAPCGRTQERGKNIDSIDATEWAHTVEAGDHE